jgi:hypothetical protein
VPDHTGQGFCPSWCCHNTPLSIAAAPCEGSAHIPTLPSIQYFFRAAV